jgi:hypothetical protein
MTIAEVREKCKTLFARLPVSAGPLPTSSDIPTKVGIPRDILTISILILASLLSFGLGYMAGVDAAQEEGVSVGISPEVASTTEGAVVASKSGMKYYLPWCAGVDRISDTNRVWFASALDARAVGYTPAANCDGL